MARFLRVSEPSIIPVASNADVVPSVRKSSERAEHSGATAAGQAVRPRMTFTGVIGTICWLPLRAIIAICVKLRIHPNILTLVGVIISVGAGWALAPHRFVLAGVVMIVANIFDFIDGKVA